MGEGLGIRLPLVPKQWSWGKNPSLSQGIEPVSQTDTLTTELKTTIGITIHKSRIYSRGRWVDAHVCACCCLNSTTKL